MWEPPTLSQASANLKVAVTMSEHYNFDNKTSGYDKIYYSNSIIITNLVQTLIPNRWFENVFPTYFGIEIS
jgi:hypothetical protein